MRLVGAPVMCSALSGARPGLVREVPAPGRPSGEEEDRPGVDGSRASAGRLFHPARRGAEEWRRDTLDDARERAHAGAKRTDATFAEAAREWLRYAQQDRACKPSRLRSYRSTQEAHLLPAFGAMELHEITSARHRALARQPYRLGEEEEQAPDRALRRVSPGAEGLRAGAQPGVRGGEAAPAPAAGS
jgi:hypothetical protein